MVETMFYADQWGIIHFAILALAVLPTYFLPAIIGGLNGHSRIGWLWILNILVGWTVLGWIALVVWSIFDLRELNAKDQP